MVFVQFSFFTFFKSFSFVVLSWSFVLLSIIFLTFFSYFFEMKIGDEMAYIQVSGAENLSKCSPGSGERFSKILSPNVLEHN